MDACAPLRILILDASAVDREACIEHLRADADRSYEVLEHAHAAQGAECLAQELVDCVLLDADLPDAGGIAFLSEVAARDGRTAVPIVMLARRDDADIAVEAMKAGAQDYAIKSRLSPEGLVRTIDNAIEKVTLRRELERKQLALNESRRQQLQMKDELLSHVSHELRTPLTAILQFVTIVLDEVAGPLADPQREFLTIVHRNALQLRDMIGDLMEVTRGRLGKLRVEPGVTEIGPVIADTVASLRGLARERNIELAVPDCRDMPRVVADAGRIAQVLANLITNAIKFSADGSAVRLAVLPVGGEWDYLQISVGDQGCGISEEGQRHIFKRLHQEPSNVERSRRGLGLGLYICRELVASHGGQIWVDSEVGVGSTFHFTLPVFSLGRLIAPLVLADEEPFDPYHVLAIEFSLGAATQSGRDTSAIFSSCRDALAELIQSRDILIPRGAPGSVAEVAFVLAAVDSEGAKAMRSRIWSTLNGAPMIRAAAVEVEIAAVPLALPRREGLQDREWLPQVSKLVERILVSHGWRTDPGTGSAA